MKFFVEYQDVDSWVYNPWRRVKDAEFDNLEDAVKRLQEEKAKHGGYYPDWHIVIELDDEESNTQANAVHEALMHDFDTQS